MKLLVLGGTRFSGHHLAVLARDRGHDVTLAHRGNATSPLDGVTHLIGDRDPNESDLLVRIAGQNYDAVIDMCGMVPRLVRVALDAVGD
ncbi:MAG: epimerase, partial [Proteobacteria bacterium]|nr:epimerase [Pseudomonadota bacterium]